ncbi:FKBP-type peptidyl-prolyl cis-trans isomerase [Novosphingobium sp. B1]|uniref:FKBP-type peptidyl-prolyl cis-trans isomerase n=1 Tax=Novosphingobium sp. B1 TaxID=1938756 RepID=UPI0009D85655|nr:FKBP-type peptidyl-prolyl cis-trans isomerase [Novosphingobium sp. B1]SMC50453.1 FKBP-type peptidyl-prolyl cis-trans isomerase FkpA [Novosphingobium sp. B1]
MSTTVSGTPRFALAFAIMAAVPALSQTASAAAPAKTAAQAATPSASVIPLPLNPVIPAAQRLCSTKAASGLGSMTLKAAEGAKPAKADYVLVNYIGYLSANGEVFDQGMQAAFPVEGVIPGFSEGLQMMAKGSTWRFCVPAALGYGAQASGPIPANSDLVFQVELVDFKTAAELEALRAAQSAASAPPSAAPAPQQ